MYSGFEGGRRKGMDVTTRRVTFCGYKSSLLPGLECSSYRLCCSRNRNLYSNFAAFPPVDHVGTNYEQ